VSSMGVDGGRGRGQRWGGGGGGGGGARRGGEVRLAGWADRWRMVVVSRGRRGDAGGVSRAYIGARAGRWVGEERGANEGRGQRGEGRGQSGKFRRGSTALLSREAAGDMRIARAPIQPSSHPAIQPSSHPATHPPTREHSTW
jgi:hypothetical protein